MNDNLKKKKSSRHKPGRHGFRVSTAAPSSSSQHNYLNRIISFTDINTDKISYESLNTMAHRKYERYLLTTKKRLNKMTEEDKLNEPWTRIPYVISYIIELFGKRHLAELEEDYFFLEILDKKHTTLKLDTVFSVILENLARHKFLHLFTLEMNAFEIFKLIVIFLAWCESPPFEIDEDFAALLLGNEYEEPIPLEIEHNELEAFKKAVRFSDVPTEDWIKKIDSHLQHLFKINYAYRKERVEKENKFRMLWRKNLTNIRPLNKQFIARFVLRNFLLQIHLYEEELTRFLKNEPYSDNERKMHIQKRKLIAIANLSTALGPVLIKLPCDMDTEANRITALSRILWINMPDVLYRNMKKSEIVRFVEKCHEGCLCGFG